jgi:hypothetical protein
MAQHDYNIANQSFPSFRSDLNNALSAIQTTNSGTSLPTGAVAGQIWLDTTNATSPTLKFYDGADSISLATINYTANTVDWLDSSVTITGLSTTATGTVLTLTDTAHTTSVNMILGNNTALRFNELTANGSNYIGLKAPASLSADLTFTLPSTDGTSGQFLKTDGSGNLSFATAGLTGATSTATGTVLTLSDTQNVASVNVILDNEKELRFREGTANGTNYVGFKAPTSLTVDKTYTLPSADGTSGQVLQTNGSGVLSFSSPSSDYVLLATTDVTSSTASVSFDGYFSSTYKNYQLIYSNLSPVTDAVNIYFRFRRSNADVTASSYLRLYGCHTFDGTGFDSGQGGTATGSAFLQISHAGISNTQASSQNGFLYIYNPLSTTSYKSITSTTQQRRGGGSSGYYDIVNATGYLQDATTALSGFTIYYSSGNIALGNFKLYGIK